MSKKLKYKLEYRDNRERKTVDIEIESISNWADREYRDLIRMVTEVSKAYERIKIIIEDKGSALLDGKNKVDGWKESIKSLEKEEEELTKVIMGYNDNDYFQRRYELVKEILEFNSCPHEFLYDFDFWDRKVDPTNMMMFLTKAIHKDLDTNTRQGGKPKK